MTDHATTPPSRRLRRLTAFGLLAAALLAGALSGTPASTALPRSVAVARQYPVASSPIAEALIALRIRAEEAAARAASSPTPRPAAPVTGSPASLGELTCSGAAGSPPLRSPSSTAPLRVWGGGDSVFGFVGLTLRDRAAATGVVDGHGEYKTSTGLSRQDYYDWPARIRAAVTQYNPEVVILMFGANDPLPLSGMSDPFGSAAWRQHYGERAAAVMTMLTAQGRQVYWLGQPVMNDPGFQAKMVLINDIVRAQAQAHPGVTYCDTERFFSGPDGGFITAPRAGDGIHLQPYAGRALAAAVLAQILGRAG